MKFVAGINGLACAGLLLVSSTFGGCAEQYGSPQQAATKACSALGPRALSGALIGTAAGAGAGYLASRAAGNKHAATDALIGALGGALIGAMAGHRLDARDCAAAQVALQKVGDTSTNQTVSWSDSATGSHGLYKPVSADYNDSKGQVCRKIQADYYIRGHQPVTGDPGIICRTPNGNWHRQGSTA